MYFAKNLRFLRLRRKRTQDVIAREIGILRSSYNSYENGSIVNPTIEALLKFSKYFRMSVDTLIKIDISNISESQLLDLERGADVFITGSKLRVIATTVDKDNK